MGQYHNNFKALTLDTQHIILHWLQFTRLLSVIKARIVFSTGPKGKIVYHSPQYGKAKKHVVSKKVKTETKSPKKVEKKEKDKVVTEKKPTPKSTPKKTVRNRIILPDLDDDTTTYINGQLFKSSRQPKPDPTVNNDSGDDDLKATYTSYSVSEPNQSDIFVDLTIGQPSTASTPKDVIQLDLDSSVKKPVRRSPRNQVKQEKKKKAEKGKVSPGAKKSLSYNPNQEDKGSRNTQSTSPGAMTFEQQLVDEGDTSMRVARLESLITTMEIVRRDEYKNRREQEYTRLQQRERMLTLLERHVADRKLIVENLANSNDNQKKLIQGEYYRGSWLII